MAERLSRLYGPAYISHNIASPTTLFTVPTGKTYLVREAIATFMQQSDFGSTTSLMFGINDLSPDALVGGDLVSTSITGPVTQKINLAKPINAGESLVAAMVYNGATPTLQQYWSSNSAAWDHALTTTNASYYFGGGFGINAFTPQAGGGKANYYYSIVNTKATTPDTVQFMDDYHTDGIFDIQSIVSAAGAGVRASIWGGYAPNDPSGSSDGDIGFNGTMTGLFLDATAINGVATWSGVPGTSNVILQTATNTGTTSTSHGVTMTPSSTVDSWQILVVGCDGVASSYTGPTGSTEMADGTIATPNATAAAYFIYPAQTNPTATIASAGTSFAAVCIEGLGAGNPAITVNGVILE